MSLILNLCIIFSILFLILLLYVTRHFNYWKNRNIPYIKPLPLIGSILNVLLQRMSIGTFMYEAYKTYKSPYLGFFVFDQPFLLIRNLDLIKSVLIKDFDYFCDRTVTQNFRDDKIGSSNLFVMKNPSWKLTRNKLTPYFSPGKLKGMLALMNKVGKQLVEHVTNKSSNNELIEVKRLCKKYAADVMASCAFGFDSNSFKYENNEFSVMGNRVFDTGLSRTIQMASYFFASFLVKPLRMKLIDPFSSKVMRRILLESINLREISGQARGDLIDCLIEMKIQMKQPDYELVLDDDELVAQGAVFFFAGFETTGTTVALTLYELSLNLDMQTRLREEINSVLKKCDFSFEAVQQMTYLDMVVSETLRKYPPLPFLDRRCIQDYQLPGTNIIVKKNIPVYISIMGLHRDPQYFPDPEKFDPERFSQENKYSIPTGCYLPFGSGLRSCIGSRFALLSSKTALISILTKFDVERTNRTPVPLIFETRGVTTSSKNDLYLKFKLLNVACVGNSLK